MERFESSKELVWVVCSLVAAGCMGDPAVGDGVPQEVRVGARGLWTSPNDLMAPEGSLKVADNVMLNDGQLEPTRGFALLENPTTLSGTINSMVFFAGSLIVHHGTNKVSRWTGSAWSQYSGTFTPRSSVSPPRFREAEGSLFLVNVTGGVYELDTPTGSWRLTGVPVGLDSTATLNRTSGTSGWMTPNTVSAYRYHLAYRNANDKIQLGAPSGRFLVVNPSSKSAAIGGLVRAGTTVTVTTSTAHGYATNDIVDMSPGEANFPAGQKTITVTGTTTFTYTEAGAAVASTVAQTFSFAARNVTVRVRLPSGLTTSHFIQLERSAMAASESDEPSDEMGLVYEVAITGADIAAGYRDIVDLVPDNLRAATPYYSPSQRGVVAAKLTPPVCEDAVAFRGCMFCANTQERPGVSLTLLAVGSTGGMQLNDEFTIYNDATVTDRVYTASAAENVAARQFLLYTTGTAAQNIAETAKSFCRVVSGDTGGSVDCFYASGPDDPPGLMVLSARTHTTDDYYVFASTNPAKYWSPALPTLYNANNLTRAGTTVTVTLVSNHDFAVGQAVYLDGNPENPDFPSGSKTITGTPASNQFTYTEAGAAGGGAMAYYVIDGAQVVGIAGSKTPADVQFDDGVAVHGLMWSDPNEPWSVPALQNKVLGDLRQPIRRVLLLRDSLLVEKDDGTWRVTGEYPNFVFTELDNRLRVVAPEASVTIANGRAVTWTAQGVQETVDSSAEISGQIASDLSTILQNAPNAVKRYAWGLSYETERQYLLAVPSADNDTSAQYIYLYDIDSQGWTRGYVTAATAGAVDPTTNKLYLGKSDGSVWVERKAGSLSDYQWPTGAISTVVEFVPLTAGKPSALKLWDTGSFDFFDARFTSMSLQFRTDWSPTLSDAFSIGPDGGSTSNPIEIAFPIPYGHQRGARLGVRMSHSLNQETFKLQSLGVNYRITSNQPRR